MVSIMDVIILGLIQGITEWLPISSSAHLALAQHFLNLQADVAFDIILHIGTLTAVLVYYHRDIFNLVLGAIKMQKKEIWYITCLLICTVPTAVIGFAFKDFFENMFSSVLMISAALVITGLFLIIAGKVMEGRKEIDVKSSFIVGIAQGIAVAPGISRSGATIGTGLLLGIEREEAAKFSFLASIIPILGAALLEGRKALVGSDTGLLPVVLGFAVSTIVGYISIALLLRFLKESKLQWFGYYCLFIAILAAATQLFLHI